MTAESLAGEIKALSLPDQLRLAASMIERAADKATPTGQRKTLLNASSSIIHGVDVELGAVLLLWVKP